jgi:hypothetical protein
MSPFSLFVTEYPTFDFLLSISSPKYQVAEIFRQELAKQLYLLKEPYSPYYKYEPQVVLEDKCKLSWGYTVLTDKTLNGNLALLQLVDKTIKEAAFIET